MSIDDEEILCHVIFLGSDDDEGDGSSTTGRKIFIEVSTTLTYIPSQEDEDEDVLMTLLDDGWKSKTIQRKLLFDRDEWSHSIVCRILESVDIPKQDLLVTRILHEIGIKMSDDFYKNSKVMRFRVRLDALKQMDDDGGIDDDDDGDDDDDDDDDDDNGGMDYDDDGGIDYDDDGGDFPVFNLIPASKSSIEGLKRVRVEEGCAQNCCTICLDEILVCSEATLMPCSHLYHCSCIRDWLEQRKFCPLCRREVA